MDEMKTYIFYVKETNAYSVRAKNKEDAQTQWDLSNFEFEDNIHTHSVELKKGQ